MAHSETPFDSREYWIARHQEFAGSHQATGLFGSSERANAVLYGLRRQALLAALNGRALAGARVLDAGCGRGDFAELYASLGAQVYGCDVSPVAIEACRGRVSGTFECGRIVDTPRLFPGVQFDLVHCFDVLYHLVDDAEWQASLEALDALSAPGAVWQITEIARARGSARHIRVRGASGYDVALARAGRQIAEERRLHWLLSVLPGLHARLPSLSPWLEPLCRWPPTRRFALVALWTICKTGDALPATGSQR